MRRALLVAAACALALAGCGGHRTSKPHPNTSNHLEVAGHVCTPADYAMQCPLAALTPPTVLPGAVRALHGIDFAWSCPSPAGHDFGASYGSPDRSKNWSGACLSLWHRAGKTTVSVWESSADRATQGYSAGVADARSEAAILAADGAPAGQPFPMAIDCDCSPPTLVRYFQGANAAEAGRVNAYGGYYQLLYLFQHHLVGHLNWQTYAWSRGLWLPASIAPLEQYLNSSSVDFDRAIAADYGQWPYARPKPKPVVPAEYKVLTHSELVLVRIYDAARKAPKTHVSELRNTERALAKLAHAVWVAAQPYSPVWGAPSWGVRNRGKRFQALYRRSLGQQLVK